MNEKTPTPSYLTLIWNSDTDKTKQVHNFFMYKLLSVDKLLLSTSIEYTRFKIGL